jgi:hypothetical protein
MHKRFFWGIRPRVAVGIAPRRLAARGWMWTVVTRCAEGVWTRHVHWSAWPGCGRLEVFRPKWGRMRFQLEWWTAIQVGVRVALRLDEVLRVGNARGRHDSQARPSGRNGT